MSQYQQNTSGYNPNSRPPPPPPHTRPEYYAADPRNSSQSPTAGGQPMGGMPGEYNYAPISSQGPPGHDRVPRPQAQQYSYTGPAYSPHNDIRAHSQSHQNPSTVQPSYNPQDYSQTYRSPSQHYTQSVHGIGRPPPQAEPRPYNPAEYRQDSMPYGVYQQSTSPTVGSQFPPPPVGRAQPTSPSAQQYSQFHANLPSAPHAHSQQPTNRHSGQAQSTVSNSSAQGGVYHDASPRQSASPRSNLQSVRYQSTPGADGGSPARGSVDSQSGWGPPRNESLSPRADYPSRTSSATAGMQQNLYSRQQTEFHQSPSIGSSLHSRPLPEIPKSSDVGADSHRAGSYQTSSRDDSYDEDDLDQDELFNEVESAVSGSHGGTPDPRRGVPSEAFDSHQSVTQTPSRPRYLEDGRRESETSNGGIAQSSHRQQYSYDSGDGDYGDDSDVEAEAGILAMRAAEEEEARGAGSFFMPVNGAPAPPLPQARTSISEPLEPRRESPDSDVIPVDIGLWGGGPDPGISYGPGSNDFSSTTFPSRSSTQQTLPAYSSRGSWNHGLQSNASVSSSHYIPGTGGLFDPAVHRGRRLSFDEGDETLNTDDQAYQPNIYASQPPDMSYFPPNTQHRPLPPPPPLPPTTQPSHLHPSFQSGPPGSETHYHGQLGPYTPSVSPPPWGRSQSLISHPSTPAMVPPNRAKTDAETKRASYRSTSMGVDSVDAVSSTGAPLDLPVIPHGRRFQPSKLRLEDFDLCSEPWALSSLVVWLRTIAESESDIREQTVREAFLALFDNKVPNMNFAEAETLAEDVVTSLLQAEVLVKEEEWLKLGPGHVTGVLYQLTRQGCYAPSLHEHKSGAKCYSYFCQRTVKKLDLRDSSNRLTGDWFTFYSLTKQDIENVNKKDVERQNVMHEIVQTEEVYMDQLNILRRLYRDNLRNANPPILSPAKIDGFLQTVFGKLDAVQKANEEYLLPQLKYRQKEQGPWITGFSDIFRDWIRKAKGPYIEYASNYVHANLLFRQEKERNKMFANFTEEMTAHKDAGRLDYNTFLKSPITRLQRYSLLLSTVLRNMTQESTEKTNLQMAIEEVRNVTLECDHRVADMSRKADLSNLEHKLVLRVEMKNAGIDLKLGQMGRELLYNGELQRSGGSRFTWIDNHAFLFDNFLVLAKVIQEKDTSGNMKAQRYDVSKMPIPMDVLVLESSNDDPVVKSSFKGTAPVSMVDARVKSTATPGSGASLSHTSTHSSISSLDSAKTTIASSTNLEGSGKDDKTMYPFRVKHLGRETYILYASSAQVRKDWCDKILEAKTKHAASLFAQNAEPFRLRVMADTAFAYDNPNGGPRTITIRGTPLSRAIDEVERSYPENTKPGPACRARVNCATTFVQPHGRRMVAVGTDYGVYISELGDTRGWSKAIPVLRVTQVAVLEDFNLFLLISDKALISYHLDVVSPLNGTTAAHDSIRKAPQKLSGTKDVGFFATGKMKDRVLVFYKKKEGLSSTFKILEPILQKATTQKTRFLSHRRGATDFFRDYDDFYIPTECMALSLFTSSLSVATSKGFEVLNLDKKTPWSIPDLSAPDVKSIAQRLSASGSALDMFRLNQTEFLCVYEECAVYVNKHGEISRGVVMEFVGHAKSAALEAGYLVLFDADFVEIRDANNGRLKQIIPGKDLRLLDDGRGYAGAGGIAPKSVKFCLQHPESERMQLVVELVLNESRRDG